MPAAPAGVSTVAEEPAGDPVAGITVYAHPGWRRRLPDVVAGITAGADMTLFGGTPAGQVVPRWLGLARALGFHGVAHAKQVHAADVVAHRNRWDGLLIAGEADGHATALDGALLAVSVADCVPISLAAADGSAIALLHGGWRGVAAGILERGLTVLRDECDVAPDAALVHFGPAICGACFEVGAEVPTQLGLLDVPEAPRLFVDLRAHLAHRAVAAGVPAANITISEHCTRCGESPFFSHRAGCAERQVALLGRSA